MSEHTPTPWQSWREAHPGEEDRNNVIIMPEEADCGGGHKYVAVGGGNIDANVAFILRAVNAHDAMVAACEAALVDIHCDCEDCYEGMAYSKCPVAVRYRQVKAAIALANTPAEVTVHE